MTIDSQRQKAEGRRQNQKDLSDSSFSPQPSSFQQALLFQRLRWRILANSWRTLVGQSSTRPLTIFLVSAVVWAFVFGVSMAGFRFLEQEVRLPLDGDIVGLLLDLMFLSLAVLLLFSSALILYGSLFTAAETNFLLSRPVADDQVFAYKFQGAVAFSSWAFLLLGGPVLIAYGLASAAPWYFYALLPLFFLGFVLLPGSLGAILALLVVNGVPRRRKQVLTLAVLFLLVLLGLWLYGLIRAAGQQDWQREGREAVTRLLGGLSFTRGPLLPSHWVSAGLRRAARGDAGGSSYYLALVWSNGLLLYLLAAWSSLFLYRRGFNRLATGGDIRRRHGGLWLDRLLSATLPFVHPSTRLLIVKDFRTFRRDPQQWGQVLLFGGLMLLYLFNMRRLAGRDNADVYQNSVSLLNLCAVALLLCTYTGRFVYPMLSLEGRKFWILGLLPVRREQLLWGKFAFATTGGVLSAEFLVLLSDLMLELAWPGILLHVVTAAVLAAGLSGLSVGLGACLPNFRETDPSKIAVGFGGTLNLIAGLLFLLVTVGLMAAPWHLEVWLTGDEWLSSWPLWLVVIGGVILGLLAGTAAVVLPLQAGIRALRQMEF
jgi:ABC-2 type transport system permease protein